jgi:hypothetical protein
MLHRNLPCRAFPLFLLTVLFSLTPLHAFAQDDTTPAPEKHGRKYKSPPDTSHVEVTVIKDFNKKPIDGAHVIFNPFMGGVNEGHWEVKTHEDGKAPIDLIPTGSKVTIQVIADGFSTFAQEYQINEVNRQIVISLIRPQAQISTYIDNTGKPADLKPGVQDPAWLTPKSKPATSATPGTSTAPSASAPAAKPNAAPASGTSPQP